MILNKPTGTSQYDLMLICIQVGDKGIVSDFITEPSGWTFITEIYGDAEESMQRFYYKVAGASEPTTYTWEFDTSEEWASSILTFSNINIANPIGNVKSYGAETDANDFTYPFNIFRKKGNILVDAAVLRDTAGASISAPNGFGEKLIYYDAGRGVQTVSYRTETESGFTFGPDAWRLHNRNGLSSARTQIEINKNCYSTDDSGELWAVGINTNGQLGQGNTTHYSSPVQVGSATNWLDVKEGYYHTLALNKDGELWSWGRADYGQLGDGTYTQKSTPIQVGTLTNWVSIAGGGLHSLGVKTDGTVYGWGSNAYGQVGDISTTHRSSPVIIGSLRNWTKLVAGEVHSLAVKNDGSIWSWGYNTNGELGLGTTTHESSPDQVGSLYTWKDISAGSFHSFAIKTDGTIWAWGINQYGQLGQNNITYYSSPVQVGSLTTWDRIVCGYNSSYAIKTDGTLWAWGVNNVGQLGQGNITSYSSPVQVGSGTDWEYLALDRGAHIIATKTNGTVWAWGYGLYGQLAQGNITSYSSPVQVGGAINWNVSNGVNQTLFIK